MQVRLDVIDQLAHDAGVEARKLKSLSTAMIWCAQEQDLNVCMQAVGVHSADVDELSNSKQQTDTLMELLEAIMP